METSELNTYIGRRFSNDFNVLSIVSQILHDELFVSYGRDLYSHCRINVASETVQPIGTQINSHGLLTIDTSNENFGI